MIAHQWTSAVIAITIAATIVWLVRHNHMHARSAGWWFIVAAAVALAGSMPGLVDRIALELGVNYPPTLVVLVGLGVVIYKLLKMDIERSKQELQIRILAQKVAILEMQLDSQNKKEETSSTPTVGNTRKSA